MKPVAQVGDSKVLYFNVASDKHFTGKNGDKVTETTWFECSLQKPDLLTTFGGQITINIHN